MSDPIRILHFADIHIGLEAYGRTDPETGLSSRAEDFFARLGEVRDYAAAHGADVAIFAGDAFQTRNPSPTYQREFARFVRELAALCPVMLLVGNHDLPASAGKAASLEIYAALGVPNVIVGMAYALHRIETGHGPVQVAAAPYPLRARLLPEDRARGLTQAELDTALVRALEDRLHALAAEADADPAPRVLAGHLSVRGARPGSEQEVMLGRDVTVALEALTDRRWDYVALGHRHRHQVLTLPGSIPPVVYSGSLERLNFGEEGEPKGFCWAEVTRGAAAWRFVPLAARPFVTVRVDARDSRDPTAVILAAAEALDVTAAVVRVIVDLSETNAHLLQDGVIRRALLAAGAAHVAAIQVAVTRPVHTRLGASPERLPPEELVRRYFEGRGVPPDRLRDLLDAAREILGDEDT